LKRTEPYQTCSGEQLTSIFYAGWVLRAMLGLGEFGCGVRRAVLFVVKIMCFPVKIVWRRTAPGEPGDQRHPSALRLPILAGFCWTPSTPALGLLSTARFMPGMLFAIQFQNRWVQISNSVAFGEGRRQCPKLGC
jgi:hypothetical protein